MGKKVPYTAAEENKFVTYQILTSLVMGDRIGHQYLDAGLKTRTAQVSREIQGPFPIGF